MSCCCCCWVSAFSPLQSSRSLCGVPTSSSLLPAVRGAQKTAQGMDRNPLRGFPGFAPNSLAGEVWELSQITTLPGHQELELSIFCACRNIGARRCALGCERGHVPAGPKHKDPTVSSAGLALSQLPISFLRSPPPVFKSCGLLQGAVFCSS